MKQTSKCFSSVQAQAQLSNKATYKILITTKGGLLALTHSLLKIHS